MNDLSTNVNNLITEASSKYVSTITQYKWDLIPDSQLQAAKQALTKSDYIMKIACGDVVAVHDALIKSAILGLDLTEGKRQGWLLPRKSQKKDSKGNYITNIHLQVGYKGIEAIHQRMGVIDRLSIRLVRENDVFEWSGDDKEKPKHEADWFAKEEERGEPKGAFAVTYYPDGSINVTVASISEIYKNHRDRSDSWKSYQAKIKEGKYAYPPPWVTDEKSMIEKTMAFIASKQWPANIRDEGTSSKILQTLHEIDSSDYSIYSLEQKEVFYEIINANDSLGMYLFSKRVDLEIYTSLFNTFPKGQKTTEKAKVREMEITGSKQMTAIMEAIEENDAGSLHENIEGCLDITIKLILAKLDDSQKIIFNELREHINEMETK